MGCSWYSDYNGRGYFYNGGNICGASVGFVSGDEVSAVVNRRTHSGNGSNGVVRFLRNRKALMAEPLPIGFAEEAVFVVSFEVEGGSAKIVSLE